MLEKGPAYQTDTVYLVSEISSIFDIKNVAPLSYHFILDPKILDDNCYYYKFYDTIEKKIKDCKIYSPFSHFKGNGFEFKRIIGQEKRDTVTIRLFDDYTKIQNVFTHDFNNRWLYGNSIYRDINIMFTCDRLDKQWYGTNPNLLIEAIYFARKNKQHFNAVKILKQV